MSSSRILDVAVVGAGPAGLAAALSLHALGSNVALVSSNWPEAWSSTDPYDLRVVALAPDAQALLQRLGVWSQIERSRAEAVVGMRIEDPACARAVCFDAAALGLPALAWIVELSLLGDRLGRAWTATGAPLIEGQVEEFAQREDHAVLKLTDGRRVKTRLVVAADGAGSPLRVAAGINVEGRDYQQKAVVCAVRTAHAHGHLARQRFLAGGPLAFLPLADGSCSIVWSTATAHAEHLLRLSDEGFCAALSEASAGMLGAIEACGARAAFPLRMQLAKNYRAQRLLLLGDAAHQVHPLAGQGLNLGLRDVRRLAEVLEWARQGKLDSGLPAVLRRYERPQRSHSWLAAHAFDGLERWFGIQQGPLAQLRRRGFALVAGSSLAKSWLARQAVG